MQTIKIDSRMVAFGSGMTDSGSNMPRNLSLLHTGRLPYAVPKIDVLTFSLANEDIICTSCLEIDEAGATLLMHESGVESI